MNDVSSEIADLRTRPTGLDFINASQLSRLGDMPSRAPLGTTPHLAPAMLDGLRAMAAVRSASDDHASTHRAGDPARKEMRPSIRREPGAAVLDRGVVSFVVAMSDENHFCADGTRVFRAYDGETPVEIVLDPTIAPRFVSATLPVWTRAWMTALEIAAVPRSAVRLPLHVTGQASTHLWIDQTGEVHGVETIRLQDFHILETEVETPALEEAEFS